MGAQDVVTTGRDSTAGAGSRGEGDQAAALKLGRAVLQRRWSQAARRAVCDKVGVVYAGAHAWNTWSGGEVEFARQPDSAPVSHWSVALKWRSKGVAAAVGW